MIEQAKIDPEVRLILTEFGIEPQLGAVIELTLNLTQGFNSNPQLETGD